MKVKIGKYRLFYNPGNRNNGILHVRAVVDGMFVCRRWDGVRWRYDVKSQYYFDINGKYMTWAGR